jgi:tyrosinase
MPANICDLSNVDRLFAIWQALNPNSYTINKKAGDGTFVITSTTTETAQTPLAPFHDASGTKFWTSEQVQLTETFNYAYPETQKWTFGSDAEYSRSVQGAVQRLYGGATSDIFADQSLNLMATPANMPASGIKGKASNGSAVGSAQKPIPEPAQPAQAPEVHHTGSHPIRHILGKAKEIFTHGSGEESEQARGLDLEAEIGKCGSILFPF